MKTKRIMSMVVASVLAITTLLGGFHLGSQDVLAAGPKNVSGTCDNDKWHYYYYKDTNTVGIRVRTMKLTKADKTLTYPNTVKIEKKSYNVSKILNEQNYVCECKKCKELDKKDKTDLHSYAFDKYVRKVVIPKNAEEIGGAAFTCCSLNAVAFEAGSKLKKICNGTSDEDNEDIYEDYDEFNTGAFAFNDIKSVQLPKSIEKIGDYAFCENGELININLAACTNLKQIGKEAFVFSGLTNVSFPASITKIGEGAFRNNDIKGTVAIPKGIKSISASCFAGNQITGVNLSNELKTIGEEAFSYNEIKSVSFPASVKTIDCGAFVENKLSKVTIPNNNMELKDECFGQNQISEVRITGNNVSVGDVAFYQNKIDKIIIKAAVLKSVDERAFMENTVKKNGESDKGSGVLEVVDLKAAMTFYAAEALGKDVIIKAEKTQISNGKKIKLIDGKDKVDLADYAELGDEEQEVESVTVEYVNKMGWTKIREEVTGDKIHSYSLNQVPLVNIISVKTKYKKYTIKGLGFDLLSVEGKKKSEYQDGNDYKISLDDEVKFQAYPDDEKFVKVGYHISGYKFEGEGAATGVFKAGASASKLGRANGTIQLELEYEANNYKIQYKKNGGDKFTVEDTECEYDKEVKLTEEIPTKEGYKFVGWSLDEDDSENVYHPGDFVKNLSEKDGDVVCMYAQWKKSKKTVEFEITPDENGEGLDAESYMVSYTINGGEATERAYPADGGKIQFEVSEVYVGDVIVVEVTGTIDDKDDDGNLLESDPSTLTVRVE